MKADSVPGWLSQHDLEAIYEIAKRVKPRTVLEIGSYFGKSSVAWAESFPETTIYCVDTFEVIITFKPASTFCPSCSNGCYRKAEYSPKKGRL